MRKTIRIIAAFSLLIFGLSSCIQDIDCPCKDGHNNQSGGTNWQVLNFSVKNSNWELCTDQQGYNPYYRAHLEIPELTKDIMAKGLMEAYVYLGSNQQTLPYVRHYEEVTTSDGESYQYLWTQTIDMEFEVGGAWVYSTASDFYVEERPGDWDFRIVLLW